MKILIPVEVDENEILGAVFENIWRDTQPWVLEYAYGGEEGAVPVTVMNPDYDYREPDKAPEYLTTQVSKFTLLNAYSALLKEGKYHCGEPVPTSLDEWDSCVSGYVLQYALFGKLIYG